MNIKLILPHRLAQKNKRAYRSAMNKERAYHSDPEILGGTLVFTGTRAGAKPVRPSQGRRFHQGFSL